MLNEKDLKTWLHRDLPQRDKALLVLATFVDPCNPADLRSRALSAGLRIAKDWNFSSILGRSRGLAISVPGGWELSENGKRHLSDLGVTTLNPGAAQVAMDLRRYLQRISNIDVRNFVEEAVLCYENGLYKSAAVMSWLAAVAVLQQYVVTNHLTAFNAEAKRIDSKWKAAITVDDLGRMKELDFLDRLNAISVIGKNRKSELIKALGLRNGCGHPNLLRISANAAAAHIEVLLLNVFDVFQI